MDQRAVANLAEMTEANNSINLLKQQLSDANQFVNTWKIEYEVDVIPHNDLYDIHVKASAGGKLFNYVISSVEARYFADDHATLIQQIAERMLVAVLAETSTKALAPKLSKAIVNVNKLISSKGFA